MDDLYNETVDLGSNRSEPKYYLELLRQPIDLLIIYCVAYGLVFIAGFVGNLFVVVSVASNPTMRNVTNYFITSLALADLLIIIFCLPATLMNNILQEWLLGNFLCKISVWVNGTTSCSSVYTLVAVTADRYFAICHTMKYNIFEKEKAFLVIIPIWLFSGILFIPYLVYFKQLIYNPPNTTLEARICFPIFPSPESERLFFLIANCLVSFLIPLIVIIVCYAYIFVAIFRHSSMAVDAGAAEREARIRMRVTNMMLTVVIVFACSWFPLYLLFTYFHFGQPEMTSPFGHVAFTILRPIFQWLSLANSCINPIVYSIYSAKFRNSFQEILVLPFRRKYQRVKQYATHTVRRFSNQRSIKGSMKRIPSRSATMLSNRTSDTTVSESPDHGRFLGETRAKLKLLHKKQHGPTVNYGTSTTGTKQRRGSSGKKVRIQNNREEHTNLSAELLESCPTSPTMEPSSGCAETGTNKSVEEDLSGTNLVVHMDSDNPDFHNSLSPVAPVVTMRDLDVMSMSPISPRLSDGVSSCYRGNGTLESANNGLISQHIGNDTENSCPLKFLYIKEVSTV